jgi:hypothetical protein
MIGVYLWYTEVIIFVGNTEHSTLSDQVLS